MFGRRGKEGAVSEVPAFVEGQIGPARGVERSKIEQVCLEFLSSEDLSVDGFNSFAANMVRLLGGAKRDRIATSHLYDANGLEIVIWSVDSVVLEGPSWHGPGAHTRVYVDYPATEIQISGKDQILSVSESFYGPHRKIEAGRIKGESEPIREAHAQLREVKQDNNIVLTIKVGKGEDLTDVKSILDDKLRIRVDVEAILPWISRKDEQGGITIAPKEFTRVDFKEVCGKVFAIYQEQGSPNFLAV